MDEQRGRQIDRKERYDTASLIVRLIALISLCILFFCKLSNGEDDDIRP